MWIAETTTLILNLFLKKAFLLLEAVQLID